MGKNIVTINGYDYNAKEGIIMVLLRVADKNGGKLSDYDFSLVVQEFEEDEERVMEDMANCTIPLFTRHATGWDVTD